MHNNGRLTQRIPLNKFNIVGWSFHPPTSVKNKYNSRQNNPSPSTVKNSGHTVHITSDLGPPSMRSGRTFGLSVCTCDWASIIGTPTCDCDGVSETWRALWDCELGWDLVSAERGLAPDPLAESPFQEVREVDCLFALLAAQHGE